MKEAQKNHRDLVKFSRERFTDREQLARDHPDDFLYIIIDGTDCKKAQSPRFRSDATFCKDLEGTGNPLKSKLTGALLLGRGFMNFWSLPRHPHDPNFTATILLRTLVEVSNSLLLCKGGLETGRSQGSMGGQNRKTGRQVEVINELANTM